MNIKNVIIGMIIIFFGIMMVVKKDWLMENIGRISFFEEKIGGGTSRLGYQLIGIAVIIVGALVIADLWGSALMGTFGSLFGSFKY